jgi:hypothetical protein
MDKQTKNIDDKKVRKNLLMFGLGGWLILGLGLFIAYGHLDFLIFPLIIICWLFGVSIILCLIFRWKKWKILLVPVLTITSVIFVVPLYRNYRNCVAENSLNEFIVAADNNNIPKKFSIKDEDLARLGNNVSLEYEIVRKDYFFGLYEWWVLFENNTEYYISTMQDSLSQWSVSAYKD